MRCDDCLKAEAVLDYATPNITFHLCIPCAKMRRESLRNSMARLNKSIRSIEARIPEAWQQFIKERQTS